MKVLECLVGIPDDFGDTEGSTMGAQAGGTKLYCPRCNAEQVCSAIPLALFGLPPEQGCVHAEYHDIRCFRRGRECRTCGHRFLTAELADHFLSELVSLRAVVATLTRHAGASADKAREAAVSLGELAGHLERLVAPTPVSGEADF